MKDNNIWVGAVIPCYHAAPFITRCLDSIYNQTFKNIRVYIVVDDKDYDDTITQILSHPLYDEKRIVCAINKNKTSPARARNKLVQMVIDEQYPNLEYIAFCDADDWWDPTKIEEQVDLMQSNSRIDLVYTLAEWNFADGHVEYHGVPYGKYTFHYLCLAPHSAVLVKKYFPFQFKFNEELKGSDDYRWLLDIEPYCRFASINKNLMHMGIHDGNLTTGKHAFVMQTVRVHLAGKEYGWAAFKFILGSGLFCTRWLMRKLHISTRGILT